MEQQLRRYFVGILSFGFIVTWIAVGTLAAFLGALGALATTTVLPALLGTRRAHRPTTQRRAANAGRPRAVSARPLVEEDAEELPLVPDEPSLIIDVAN